MNVSMYTTGVPVNMIDPEIINSAYTRLRKRKGLPLPPKKNIVVTAGFDGNFTLATILYRGRGPISHRHEVLVAVGAAKGNPNDNPNSFTGIALATYRAMRQLGVLMQKRKDEGVSWNM